MKYRHVESFSTCMTRLQEQSSSFRVFITFILTIERLGDRDGSAVKSSRYYYCSGDPRSFPSTHIRLSLQFQMLPRSGLDLTPPRLTCTHTNQQSQNGYFSSFNRLYFRGSKKWPGDSCKDLNLVPSTYISQLTTAVNSNSTGSKTLFYVPKTPTSTYKHTFACTTHTNKNNKKT